MLLQNKNAVIYAGAGAIGSAVARTFAREGARVFLTGRNLSAIDAVAKSISAEGGQVETAQVDALNERAIEMHIESVLAKAGRVDVSFNAIGIPQNGIQGTPLVQLAFENFLLPSSIYLQSHFLTARTAARYMLQKKSGVILTLTATPAKLALSLVGGMGPAWAGLESLSRGLAAELGPQGVRVICLRSDAIPETATIDRVFDLHARTIGIPRTDFQGIVAGMTQLRRLPQLQELADVAAFVASDRANAMTATVANLSCGSVAD